MAALLRSARLLKFSPSGLLQITGTKRTGPPIGRLYSGAVGSKQTGVCSRQISRTSDNAPSQLWPYTVGCVRNYALASERRNESGATVVRNKQMQQFDWALAKLDNSVRRTGRITKTLLLRIFHDICRTGYPSSNQALLLLRSCGYLLPEVPPQERTDLAHRIWEKLQELGSQYDVSHYNAMLKVYLQNEFQFSPTDFLAKMEAANIQPNRVTYQRLITAYCQSGNIEGASTILGFMKSKDLPITDAVFNSLVMGHARAGDIESAKNILPVMRGAGIEPGPDTYVSLLKAHAERGDLDSLKQTMVEAESADCCLTDRDIMQVISTLAKAGQQQHIPEIVKCLKNDRGYVPDAMNLCLSLITQGFDDTAFLILKTFPTLQTESFNPDSSNLGNFFIRHCVNMERPLEKINSFCKDLEDSKLHSSSFSFALCCALEANKTAMALELMKILKEQDFPIRPHYFWPLLTQHLKDKSIAGVIQVLKGMQEFGVPPDIETLSHYVLPVFSDVNEAQQALQEAGIPWESEGCLSAEIRLMANNDLDKLYTRLSDPSFPPVDHSSFRNSLISGFKKSNDAETMVKITELLFKDQRFSRGNKNPGEVASYFLYNLIDSMTEREIQRQEEKLRTYFKQLHAQKITIPLNIFRGIRNLLEMHHTPELVQDVRRLVDPKEQASNDSSGTATVSTKGRMVDFEKKIAELKAENQPTGGVLKRAIVACAEENLESALELKQKHEEEMTAGTYATLINLCCRHSNFEEALNLKTELSQKFPSAVLDAVKYIELVRVLAKNGKVDEAVDLLKEMKEKDVVLDDSHSSLLFYVLNSLVTSGGVTSIPQLLDTIFTLGLAKPNANLCSPLITAHLEKNDLEGALKAVQMCQSRYSLMPRIHDVIVGLAEKGDTALLQTAMDFVSRERGEMSMLYDLFFAFLQTGRYREARKVIETPGLRARPGRIHWFAEKCIANNQIEALEQMLDATAKLFECDRDVMYSYVLRYCKKTNDWKKAEALWTKMQEENVIPRERTLRLLADVLRNNGQEVPFEVPETWYQEAPTPKTPDNPETPADLSMDCQVRLIALCKRGKAQEALEMLKDADKKGMVLSPAPYDRLIRALLAEGSLEDAMVVSNIAAAHVPGFKLSDTASTLLIITLSKKGQTKDAVEKLRSMLQTDQLPGQMAITRLVQALGNQGNIPGIEEVESLLSNLDEPINLSTMVFTNNKALAHIKNGDLEAAVEELEKVLMNSEGKTPSIAFVYRKVLEEGNEKAFDKLSVMAERLANHFACYRPATDLFLKLLDMGRVEDAKFMLARCNAVAEQKETLISYVTRKATVPKQVDKIKSLVSLIPDVMEKDTLYAYLMKCHTQDKDFPAARALYELMQEEGIAMDKLSLKRLSMLYHSAGETPPFPEPPESFKFYADKLKEKNTKAQETAEE
ncbi:leucine-rich PPR motif-containing protein, mitochondrial [Halichoeres trimaculatus]|uniref:leucine-rich PPR motif-containing protein, mitochondrial n=1 Tax=Halichoeres trimaculatus TaxID=147232 RepID=UPI003D9F22A7